MEASPNPQDTTQAKPPEEAEAQTGPTAKEMAAAEEANALRAQQIINRQQEEVARAAQEEVSIIGLAAQGREVLLEQLRQHAERTKKPEYIPPPRTARQMSQLEEELEAGRRSQAKAQAQLDSRPPPEKPVNEGFTTPVHRPGDFVPDLNSRDPAIK